MSVHAEKNISLWLDKIGHRFWMGSAHDLNALVLVKLMNLGLGVTNLFEHFIGVLTPSWGRRYDTRWSSLQCDRLGDVVCLLSRGALKACNNVQVFDLFILKHLWH
jgi:hypothetical protein